MPKVKIAQILRCSFMQHGIHPNGHTTLNQGQYITSMHRKENIEKLPCHFDVLFDVIAMDEKLKSF